MERRVLLAIFLSFLVLWGYQALLPKPAPKPASSAPGAAAVSAPGAPGGTIALNPTVPARAAVPSAPAVLGAPGERDVRVETRDVIAVFTNRGARLKSWRLKHHFDQNKQPLELVANELADTQPLPFSLRVSDDAVTTALNSGLYAVTLEPAPDAASAGPSDVRFEYRDSAGVHAIKEFHFEPTSYIVAFRDVVTQGDKTLTPAIQWGPAVGDAATEVNRFTVKAEGLYETGGKISRLAPKDIAKQPMIESDFRYAGVDDQYFMTVAIAPAQSRVTYQAISIPPPAGSKDAPRDLIAYAIEPMRPGGAAAAPLKFFAGPKDFDVLFAIDHDFVRTINFGMFSVLVVPLLRSLKWINAYVGNYGWSIILLTVIINAFMFPLRHKSVVSMRKMQEIQPLVKSIQDRYAKFKATDPEKQKMNQELMALYKERGVNPASGCVPMLLTMPVLFAFYALLSTAIELRGAPFVGWIHDLSLHDPLYVTPVLMGISQLWQQRITPAVGADPAQQKTMMLMPVVFTFMFLWAPAGVALYWLMANLWGIGQQYLTNYIIGPPKVLNVRPPAERQMKRVGGGKTDAAAREN